MNIEDIKKHLRTIKVFQDISDNTLDIIASKTNIRTYNKGEGVFWDKEPGNIIYAVVDGFVELYKISSLGEKKIIFVYNEGNILNEVILQDLPASINCMAQKKSALLAIPKETLLYAMEQDFNLTKLIIDSMAIKIRRLYRQLKNTTNSLRGDKKIAAKLWKLGKDYGIVCSSGIKINMDISITHLADMVGSTRETVSRQVKQLVQEGLIIVKKNTFIIPDMNELGMFFKSV